MKLIDEIQSCIACKSSLPYKPKPVVSFSKFSKIIIIGQAPGIKVHNSGIPWDDASGKRLREWLGVSVEEFYNIKQFGIVPMGFCYSGKGKSGDLPPRPECAELWMNRVLGSIENIKVILLIGQYSQKYFLKQNMKKTLTETVKNWENYLPKYVVLPHPSPRNNIWLKKNAWFEKENITKLKKLIKKIMN
jgi:uracil-DNA glycosylase